MGKEIISGEDFYSTVVDMGEEVEFLTDPIIKQYASITAYRATGTTNLTDGVYQYRGVMTFDSVQQQNELIGEYFKRQTNKASVHILTGVLPENTTYKIGQIYAVECNDKVDIISHYVDGAINEFGEREKEPVYIAKDVDCYITVISKNLYDQTPGSYTTAITNLLLPAKTKLTLGNTVIKKGFVYDSNKKENVYMDVKYKVESVDASLMDILEIKNTNEDGETVTKQKYVGVLRCTITEDIG